MLSLFEFHLWSKIGWHWLGSWYQKDWMNSIYFSMTVCSKCHVKLLPKLLITVQSTFKYFNVALMIAKYRSLYLQRNLKNRLGRKWTFLGEGNLLCSSLKFSKIPSQELKNTSYVACVSTLALILQIRKMNLKSWIYSVKWVGDHINFKLRLQNRIKKNFKTIIHFFLPTNDISLLQLIEKMSFTVFNERSFSQGP